MERPAAFFGCDQLLSADIQGCGDVKSIERRVDCRACGVRVEELPWAIGKHQLTKAYMLFLAHWARKLSWQETAVAFRSSWDKVCQAVEYKHFIAFAVLRNLLAEANRSINNGNIPPKAFVTRR
jgi:hypothetical protein